MWTSLDYTIAAHLLPRLLGFIYFWAIGAFLFQILGLIGKEGILPVKDYLDSFRNRYPFKRFYYIPTLFWINATNQALMGLVAGGTVISIFLMLGIYPSLCLALLFIIYLSIVSVGQDFLSFGWESLLLEITFYAFWVSLTPLPNQMMWICLNFLLFRFHFQAGLSKLQSHDQSWRDLTALSFHYQTQPLPNTWAWFAAKCPLKFHQASTFAMFLIELAVPFGLFLTDQIRAATGAALITLQVIIWLTGNLSFLNYLTAAFSMISFSNGWLLAFIQPIEPVPSHPVLIFLISTIGTLFLVLQLLRFVQQLRLHRSFQAKGLYWLSPFHLVNRYGLFAVMTKERIEIIIEGSDDGIHWKEYFFKYKPSEITRRPRRISPFQPRLDWQMWFLPFSEFESETWFHRLIAHLLKGTPAVLKLIRYNPFPDKPPLYIRAVMYDYVFSQQKQKKEYGWWWQREFLGMYSPVIELKKS